MRQDGVEACEGEAAPVGWVRAFGLGWLGCARGLGQAQAWGLLDGEHAAERAQGAADFRVFGEQRLELFAFDEQGERRAGGFDVGRDVGQPERGEVREPAGAAHHHPRCAGVVRADAGFGGDCCDASAREAAEKIGEMPDDEGAQVFRHGMVCARARDGGHEGRQDVDDRGEGVGLGAGEHFRY